MKMKTERNMKKKSNMCMFERLQQINIYQCIALHCNVSSPRQAPATVYEKKEKENGKEKKKKMKRKGEERNIYQCITSKTSSSNSVGGGVGGKVGGSVGSSC